jgi:hypothetical protein
MSSETETCESGANKTTDSEAILDIGGLTDVCKMSSETETCESEANKTTDSEAILDISGLSDICKTDDSQVCKYEIPDSLSKFFCISD